MASIGHDPSGFKRITFDPFTKGDLQTAVTPQRQVCMTVEERITRLEKTNHVWKLATTGFALALVAIVVTSCEQSGNSGTSEIVRTKHLEIVSPLGKAVVTLVGNQAGGGYIGIYNSQGKLVFALTETKDERCGSMSIYNSQGQSVVDLGGNEGEGGILNISNPQGKPVFKITETKDGNGLMGIFNSQALRWSSPSLISSIFILSSYSLCFIASDRSIFSSIPYP